MNNNDFTVSATPPRGIKRTATKRKRSGNTENTINKTLRTPSPRKINVPETPVRHMGNTTIVPDTPLKKKIVEDINNSNSNNILETQTSQQIILETPPRRKIGSLQFMSKGRYNSKIFADKIRKLAHMRFEKGEYNKYLAKLKKRELKSYNNSMTHNVYSNEEIEQSEADKRREAKRHLEMNQLELASIVNTHLRKKRTRSNQKREYSIKDKLLRLYIEKTRLEIEIEEIDAQIKSIEEESIEELKRK